MIRYQNLQNIVLKENQVVKRKKLKKIGISKRKM